MIQNSCMFKPSPPPSPRRRPIGAPVYQTSLKGLQEQALLHRICAELMTSATNPCIFVTPTAPDKRLHITTTTTTAADAATSSKNWVRRERVLEILDGALCIAVDEEPLAYAAEKVHVPLSYATSTRITTPQNG